MSRSRALLPRLTLPIATALLLSVAPALDAQVQWGPVPQGHPRTAAEMNGFTAHTRHLEMWDYLEQLRGVSSDMRPAESTATATIS